MGRGLGRGAALLVRAGWGPGGALAADSVDAMCLELDAEDVCACASEALLAEIGPDDYAIYEAIGADYVERLAAGEDRGDAWTAASRPVADRLGISGSELMRRTNDLGKAHREAMESCRG
jgi:hypothetical protein